MTLPELDALDRKHYSLSRALAISEGMARAVGTVEREWSDAASKALGPEYGHGGFFVPLEPRAALDSGTATAGQELRFTHPRTVVDFLFQQSKLLALGARWETDVPFNATYPRVDGAVTFEWVAEDPGSDQSDTDATLASVSLSLHSLQGTTGFSRQLLVESKGGAEGVDAILARHLAQGAATALDLAGIQGSGASNQPTGVLNTSGIGSVAGGTNGAVPTYANMVDLEYEVAIDDADAGRLGYLTTPGIRRKLRNTEQFTGAGPIWRGGRVLEYSAAASNQVPSTLSKGTASGTCHAVLFGDFSQLVLASLGMMELVTDPVAKKKQGLIEVTAYLFGDIAVLHPQAFAAMKDALTA